MTLKETGYELYDDGVSASLIRNKYDNADSDECEDGVKIVSTAPHRNGNTTINRNGHGQIQEEEEEVDPKVINQKPIDIGPDSV